MAQRAEDTGERPLPRDLEDCLAELATGVRKYSIYPAGHPTLEPVADRVRAYVERSMATRGRVSVSVTRKRLLVAGAATEPRNDLTRGLAERLYEHRLLSVSFLPGLDREEIAGLLGVLSVDPRLGSEPLGALGEDELGRWPHVQIQPLRYDPLELGKDDESREELGKDGSWLGEPAMAFPTYVAGADLLSAEPPRVADLIEARLGDEVGDRVVAVELFRLAANLTRTTEPGAGVLMRKMSELVMCLEPDSLGHLMELGDFDGRTNQFLRDSAEWMAAEAVVKLLRVAAEGREDQVAPWLLRLMSKLATFIPDGPTARHAEAEGAIRETVERMITSWELDDPRPGTYRAQLSRYVRRPARDDPDREEGQDAEAPDVVEAERIVQIGLELDDPCEGVLEATSDMVREGQAAALVQLLEGAPPGCAAVDVLWRRMVTPDAVRQLMEQDDVNFSIVDRVLAEVGVEAAGALLDTLARARSRRARRLLFDRLVGMGPAVLPAIQTRLADDRWFVLRNLLALIAELGVWPDDFLVKPFLQHRDARVRAEAARVALAKPGARMDALLLGLQDEEERVVGPVLAAVGSGVPRTVEELVVRLLRDDHRTDGLRIRAVQALERIGSERALAALADFCLVRRWFFWRRLAAPSPVRKAAAQALATRWPDDRRARAVTRGRALARSEAAEERGDPGDGMPRW